MNPEILIVDWNEPSSSSSSSNSSVVLEIEFDDRENELKYDRLVTEKKIKSPFKRKHSNEQLGKAVSNHLNLEENDSSENDMKKFKQTRSESECSSPVPNASEEELETRQDVLDRRQKQIDYGKNTQGYINFVKSFPNK